MKSNYLFFWITLSILLFYDCSSSKKIVLETPTTNLDELANREFSGKDVLYWDENVLLSWEDFKINFDLDIVHHAQSATGIYSFWECNDNHYEFIVGCVFDRTKSWVKYWVKFDRKNTSQLLNHEQTHFDLTEVYARKIRYALSTVPDPCRKSQSEMKAIVNKLLEEFKTEEKRYDSATKHGRDTDKQLLWDKNVYRMLEMLDQYKEYKYVYVK